MSKSWYFPGRIAAIVALVMSTFGCATSYQIPACQEVLTDVVTVRLINQFADQINGEATNLGRFEVASYYKNPLEISGWQRAGGFLILDPIARIELRKGQKWVDVLTTMVSYMATGDHVLTIRYQDKHVLVARLDYGIPEGKHEMRLVIRSNDGICLVSDSFFSEVKKPRYEK